MNKNCDIACRFVFPVMLTAIIFLTLTSVFGQSGNGGGEVGIEGPNPLPQTPPAPNVLMRDSFGTGTSFLRPAGGKGLLVSTSNPLGGFWLEYLGSKDVRWISPTVGRTWNSVNYINNPNELFSPLQDFGGVNRNGCVMSYNGLDTVNPPVAPSAIVPLPNNFTTPFEVEINGFPAPLPGAYLAVGLTDSNVAEGNLATRGNIVAAFKYNPANPQTLIWEVRLNGMNGQLLASGLTNISFNYNRIKLRYAAQTRNISVNIDGAEKGIFTTNFAPSKFVGFEGTALADNFVVRTLP